MSSDIRLHASHALPSTASSPRLLPLKCPHCQQTIDLAIGLCGNRQIDAILLQAERIGAELECRHCNLRFVFHRSDFGSRQAMTPDISSRRPDVEFQSTAMMDQAHAGGRMFLRTH